MKETPLKVRGYVELKHYDKDLNLIETRNFENLVVTTGLEWIASCLNTPVPPVMNWIGFGTSNQLPALGDTALIAEIYRKDVQQAGGGISGNTIVYSLVLNPGEGDGALQEAGIFNNSPGGTMLSRVTFPTLNKGPTDTIGVTWTIVIG